MIVIEDSKYKLEFAINEQLTIKGVYRIRQDIVERDVFFVTRFQKLIVGDDSSEETLTNFDRSYNADTTIKTKKQVLQIFQNMLGEDIPIKITSSDYSKYDQPGEHEFVLKFKPAKEGYMAEVKTMLQK